MRLCLSGAVHASGSGGLVGVSMSTLKHRQLEWFFDPKMECPTLGEVDDDLGFLQLSVLEMQV